MSVVYPAIRERNVGMRRSASMPAGQLPDRRYIERGAGPSPSPGWIVWLAALTLFLLAATNSSPAWWSSGLFSAILAPLMILGRGPRLKTLISKENGPIFLSLIVFALTNLLSAAVTPTEQTALALLLRCVLPLLIYVSMVGLVLRPSDVTLLVFALAAGSSVIFVRGLYAYWAAWGIPDLQTVLWGRFNVGRMAGYARATFGNVGHMGSYVVLVLPPLALAGLAYVRGLTGRIALATSVFLGVTNLLVSGSRTGLVVLLLAVVIIALSRGARGILVSVASVGVVFLVAVQGIGSLLSNPQIIERYLPSLGSSRRDISALYRIDSISVGWRTFTDNFAFGVGPAMSPFHNVYSVPHESIVHQLSELGILGGASFIWLNGVVFVLTFAAARAGPASEVLANRFLWLIGPACWLFFGIIGGITFNMSWSLVWIGIVHAMLALSGAVLAPQSKRNAFVGRGIPLVN